MLLKKIIHCARCGGDHENVDTKPFAKPFRLGVDTWTHWAPCPTNGEPILVTGEASPEDEVVYLVIDGENKDGELFAHKADADAFIAQGDLVDYGWWVKEKKVRTKL